MSRQDTHRRAGVWTARLAPRLAWGLAIAAGLGSTFGPAAGAARAQQPPAPAPTAPAPAPPLPAPTLPPSAAPPAAAPAAPMPVASAPELTSTPAPAPGDAAAPAPPEAGAPGTAVVDGAPVVPSLSPDIQVVRFHGPEGVQVTVMQPAPEVVSAGDNHGLLTVGLKVGVPYRLKLSNLPERPGAEIFPVIEIVGHLHRPPGIDPSKYPIRVAFSLDDLYDVVDRARLVTQVIYLEDPDQALPLSMPKDQIPVVTLLPSEDPIRVGAALGRVMAVLRVGNRQPLANEPPDDPFVGGPGAGGPCPFIGSDGGRCPVACGPVVGTAPPPGRPWAPRDEFLCDGGDRGDALHFGGDGGLRGIDPRDAAIRFDDGKRPRVLPTNVVCLYAPRFAEVRTSLGTNEALSIAMLTRTKYLEKQATEAAQQGPKRLTQNQAAELGRHRARASGLASRVRAGVHSELRVLSGYDNATTAMLFKLRQNPDKLKLRQKAALAGIKTKAVGIKTAESAVVTGIVEGAGEMVMTWPARETVGVEVPPNRPGLAVIKRLSASEAEAGDEVTFVIQYRNMGNTPIRSVSIVDSLLPRLGYVAGTAQGPEGTVFTAGENRVGSTELRWEIPGTLAPGAEGMVSFKAIVR